MTSLRQRGPRCECSLAPAVPLLGLEFGVRNSSIEREGVDSILHLSHFNSFVHPCIRRFTRLEPARDDRRQQRHHLRAGRGLASLPPLLLLLLLLLMMVLLFHPQRKQTSKQGTSVYRSEAVYNDCDCDLDILSYHHPQETERNPMTVNSLQFSRLQNCIYAALLVFVNSSHQSKSWKEKAVGR